MVIVRHGEKWDLITVGDERAVADKKIYGWRCLASVRKITPPYLELGSTSVTMGKNSAVMTSDGPCAQIIRSVRRGN
jgi:hypothetical protein